MLELRRRGQRDEEDSSVTTHWELHCSAHREDGCITVPCMRSSSLEDLEQMGFYPNGKSSPLSGHLLVRNREQKLLTSRPGSRPSLSP